MVYIIPCCLFFAGKGLLNKFQCGSIVKIGSVRHNTFTSPQEPVKKIFCQKWLTNLPSGLGHIFLIDHDLIHAGF